jgi:adenylylsulfate kinase
VRVGLVTGTVGVGKSTVGYAVARHAAALGVPAAFVDLDGLSRMWPAPAGDPFTTELILTNARSVVGNYEAAGAQLLVLAWVVVDADGLAALEAAVGAPVAAVRLTAPAPVVAARLRQRHQGPEHEGLAWHLHRAPELATIQDRALDLPTIDASGPVPTTASAIAALWT